MAIELEYERQIFDRYKFALLCEDETCQDIENEIRSMIAASADSVIRQLREFAAANRLLIRQAFEFGKQGIPKESGEFQNFISQIKKQQDDILTEAVFSSHGQGFAEYDPGFASYPGAGMITGDSCVEDSSPGKKKNIPELIEKIKTYRSWISDAGKQRELKEIVEDIDSIDPEQGKYAGKLLAAGKLINDFFSRAYRAGMKDEQQTFNQLRKQFKKSGGTALEFGKLRYNFQKGKKKRQLFISAPKHIPTPAVEVPYYAPDTNHPFYIGNLSAEAHWRIFVDETGGVFDKSVFSPETKEAEKGKFVALFVPGNSRLPAIGKHHATDSDTAANKEVLSTLFKQGENCGILGITLDAMAQVDLDYWHAGLERLFDISLRLLPVDGSPVKLDFYIENRGAIDDIEKTAAAIRRTADVSLYHLARSFPAKAELISIRVFCQAKTVTDNKVFNAFNGYVDTVACAWSKKRKELTGMLKKGGFLHRCLLDGDIQEFPEIMDRLEKNELPAVEQWNKLLNSPDRQVIDSPINALLEKLGFILHRNVDAWKMYVDAVVSHLDSKAIRMTLLGKQINFLTAYMPCGNELPKRLKIIWLTAKLAEENHLGAVAQDLSDELEKLLPDMYLEDAPLCCWSILHQAVTRTNAYRFDQARQIIERFSDNFDLLPRDFSFKKLFPDGKTLAPACARQAAVIGLRYFGQLLSSLGQHDAFSGNCQQAHEYFISAIRCFSMLSDGGALDMDQTLSYCLTNAMDYVSDPLKLNGQMETYLKYPLTDAAALLAADREPANKYRHHIMLRYFQLLPKTHPAVQMYLDLHGKWRVDHGHPWELIEFYRALLVQDDAERVKHLEKSAAIAEEGGPALHIIACVILGSWYYYDRQVRERFEQLVQQTVSELPDWSKERLAALNEQLAAPADPLEFAKAVLPFNFR